MSEPTCRFGLKSGDLITYDYTAVNFGQLDLHMCSFVSKLLCFCHEMICSFEPRTLSNKVTTLNLKTASETGASEQKVINPEFAVTRPCLPIFAFYSEVGRHGLLGGPCVDALCLCPLPPGTWTIPSMTCSRWWGMPTDLCRMTRGAVSSCARAPKRLARGLRIQAFFPLLMEVLVSPFFLSDASVVHIAL